MSPFRAEQGAVPPEMMLQVVAPSQFGASVVSQSMPSLRRPCISITWATACAAHRSPGSSSMARRPAARPRVVPGLLVGEAAAGEHRCVAGDILRPGRDHALDRGDHVLRTAEPEIDEMGEAEGHHVEWMGAQDRFPQSMVRSSSPVGPGGQGGDMARSRGVASAASDCAVRAASMATGTEACL